jgi:hypothetical protein
MARRFFPVNYKLCAVFLAVFLAGTLYADDEYRWELVNAFSRGDVQTAQSVINANIAKMTEADKRLVMNFAFIYSNGENTLKIMDIFRRHNVFPNSYDLFTAINRNQPDAVIQSILNNGTRANGEILLLAMEKQRFDIARQIVETGVDVNYQYPLSKSYADGMTPLLYASKWNNFDLVRLLVERGANLNTRSKDGGTALSFARANGNTQIYGFLIQSGADETGNSVMPPPQNTGIASILENQTAGFQTGTYRRSGGSTDIRFSGSANFGSISYTANGRQNNGFYRVDGGNITITIEGRAFIYKMDSNMSFSGNGEVWVRSGN